LRAYGLTGGIGAGKSTVSRILKLIGVPIYDADTEAKRLTYSDPDIISRVASIFGAESVKDGHFNRDFVAKEAFAFPEKLDELNKIIHPVVTKDYQQWITRQNASYVIREAAILFETGGHKDLDGTILVSAPIAIRIQRVLKRDPHRDEKQVEQIINRQWPEEKKKELANFFITNEDDQLLLPQVLRLHDQLLR